MLVYAPVRRHEFVNLDDPAYVVENPQVGAGLTWSGARWAFTTGHAGNWHPLTWLSHMLDVQLFGMDAGPHHVTSALLHVANTLLLFGLLQRTTGAAGRSAVVAALFAVHPLHVESVAWVAERKDVLSAFFGLLAIWSYARYVRRPSAGRYAVVAMLFGLGLLSKPMLVTLPLVLLLLDFWPLGRLGSAPVRRLLLEKLPLLAMSVASSLVTLSVQQQAGAVRSLESLPLWYRVANASTSYVVYLGQTLWPANLAAFYPFPESFPPWQLAACGALLAALSIVTLRAARHHPWLAFGWLFYVVTLLPVIGLVQVGVQAHADRYTYLPLIGVFVAAVWGVAELTKRRPRLGAAGATLLVLACATAARAQVGHWRDSVALWEHALSATRANYRAHANLGHVLAKQGRTADAVVHYEEALRLQPGSADTHNNLGLALASLGRSDDAIRHYREALRAQPDYAEALNNLGIALLESGSAGDAVDALSRASALRPDLPGLRRNLAGAKNADGVAFAQRGRAEEAVVRYREALGLEPDLAEARVNLGRTLAAQGRTDDAIDELQHAQRLRPGDADLQYDLAVLLHRKGRTGEALQRLEAALRLEPGHEAARNALRALEAAGAQRSR
jgi:Flp pilus assembly protein TadD